MEPTRGVQAIVTYKLAKATVQLVLAAVLLALGTDGVQPVADALAHGLRHHAAEGWSVTLGAKLAHLFTERRLYLTCVALAGDGVLSAVEGTLLARGVTWAPWLIVVAGGLLLPFELIAIFRHFALGRVLLFVVNGAIVAYLLHHALGARVRHLVRAR